MRAAREHPPLVGVDLWSRLPQVGLFLLILGSAFTAPLFKAGTLTLTGDRLLGLVALVAATGLCLAARLRWTPIHTALAVFVGVQVLTSMLNAGVWPQGLKFVTVYVLGFACFCLAAEWARNPKGQRRLGTSWIMIGAGLGLIGSVVAVWANLSQKLVWGTGITEVIWFGNPRLVFAGKATFGEWNLLSSFLLIPFALGLWRWPRDTRARWLTASLGAVVFGLALGFTRAAWVSMAGIIAFWWWVRRPGWRQVAALGVMLVLAFALQVAVTSRRPVPGEVYQSSVQWRQPQGTSRHGTQFQWEALRRERYIALSEIRRIQTAGNEEKRPLSELEEQRIRNLADEVKRIERAIRALEPPFWSPATLAERFRTSAFWSRLVEPVKTGLDWNMMTRMTVSRITIESWLRRPIVGHGAGSINRFSAVLPDGQRFQKIWNGNLVLFVLHDSGLVGFAALLLLAVAVWRRGARAISRGGADGAMRSPTVPLLAVGAALCFAYQFTHALWLMYPYVYLGLLTGATDESSSSV